MEGHDAAGWRRHRTACRRRFWGAYPIGGRRPGAQEHQPGAHIASRASRGTSLPFVVKYDNISAWREAMAADDPSNTAHFVDQSGTEGIRDISAGCPVDMSWCLDDGRRGRKSRPCKTHARHGLGRLRDCSAISGQRLSRGLCGAIADEVWVVHAFKKKSTRGIKTPKHEADLVRDRLKRLKEMLV